MGLYGGCRATLNIGGRKLMKAGKQIAAGFVLAAAILWGAGTGHAKSKDYCSDHPHDKSHYCFCYHHPKECNRAYRVRYPDWNRRPDRDQANHNWDENHDSALVE
jgi:hypothetical protein